MTSLRTLAIYAAVVLATVADLARPALARLRTAAALAVLAASAAADAVVTFAWSLACGAARPGGLAAAVTSARYRAAYHLAETADRAAGGQVTSLSVRPGPVLRALGAPNPLEGGPGHEE
jgi:hypothetical protein